MFLFGREGPQAEISEALAASRVVVLVGPPGIGKSALAASFCVDRSARWIDASGSLAAEGLERATTGRRDAELIVIDDVGADESLDRLRTVFERALVPVLITSRRALGGGLAHLTVPPLAPAAGARRWRRAPARGSRTRRALR